MRWIIVTSVDGKMIQYINPVQVTYFLRHTTPIERKGGMCVAEIVCAGGAFLIYKQQEADAASRALNLTDPIGGTE